MNEIKELLEGIKLIIGVQGPVYLDTNIYEHSENYYGDYYNKFYDGNWKKKDIIKFGKKGKLITIDDIFIVFDKIFKNEKYEELMEGGRSYFFEGITKEYNDKFNIIWGS